MADTTPGPSVGWLKGAATDAKGLWDAAYIGLLVLTGIVAVTALVEIALVGWAWQSGKAYDPQPLGVAVAAICGGYATALGGLAGYMAATRPHGGDRE